MHICPIQNQAEMMTTGIPDYQAFFEPILSTLQLEDGFTYIDEINESVSEILKLSTDQLNTSLPSGRQTVFENNLQWALSYLEQAHLIETDGSSAYRITSTALCQIKAGAPIHLNVEPSRNIQTPLTTQIPPSTFTLNTSETNACLHSTDDEPDRGDEPNRGDTKTNVKAEFERMFEVLKHQLLLKIYDKNPAFFENLIIDLLLAMGYGNRRRDLTAHLGRTGDGGIDGAINQDQLGLDIVYIQAKRYKQGSSVPVSAVRDFAGAIEAHKANKGVLVTTSSFTRSSRTFVAQISKRIVLIDGDRLCELLIRNNIGVKIRETFEVKRIDEDYFS